MDVHPTCSALSQFTVNWLNNWCKLENVEHCGGEPDQAVLWLHAHEQTKLHAE